MPKAVTENMATVANLVNAGKISLGMGFFNVEKPKQELQLNNCRDQNALKVGYWDNGGKHKQYCRAKILKG